LFDYYLLHSLTRAKRSLDPCQLFAFDDLLPTARSARRSRALAFWVSVQFQRRHISGWKWCFWEPITRVPNIDQHTRSSGNSKTITAVHSKKLENHVHMVALYTTWYNFGGINQAVRMSPAMACGLTQKLWGIADIVKLIEDTENMSA
jgi:hypothetical protein